MERNNSWPGSLYIVMMSLIKKSLYTWVRVAADYYRREFLYIGNLGKGSSHKQDRSIKWLQLVS